MTLLAKTRSPAFLLFSSRCTPIGDSAIKRLLDTAEKEVFLGGLSLVSARVEIPVIWAWDVSFIVPCAPAALGVAVDVEI